MAATKQLQTNREPDPGTIQGDNTCDRLARRPKVSWKSNSCMGKQLLPASVWLFCVAAVVVEGVSPFVLRATTCPRVFPLSIKKAFSPVACLTRGRGQFSVYDICLPFSAFLVHTLSRSRCFTCVDR